MKFEVDDNLISTLNHLKDKIILIQNNLYVIRDFKFYKESKIVKPFFSKEKVVVKNYITEMTIIGYSVENKYLTRMADESCEIILEHYFLQKLRRDWVNITDQLKAFGFVINPNGTELNIKNLN